MNRTEIEMTLSADRNWLLNTLSTMTVEQLNKPCTPSEHDGGATMWSYKDHFVHLALIEHNFNAMTRRFLAGNPSPVRIGGSDLVNRPREEIMASVHLMTEEWKKEHENKSWDEVVAIGQKARGETLALLAELTDEQLQLVIPGAPWAEGVVGGILAANAGHGRMHFNWAKQGEAALVASA